ncbi:hypothetical protein EDC01DRAFT_763411 [Geopyxis carbonaria]|nr:hypothetical protein EDC01DRAFT_763411 [Geopyxis carbonaria]
MGNQLSTLYERLSFETQDDWLNTAIVCFIVAVVFVAFINNQKIVAMVKGFNQASNLEDVNSGHRREIDSVQPQDPAKIDTPFIVTDHADDSTKDNSAIITKKTSNGSIKPGLESAIYKRSRFGARIFQSGAYLIPKSNLRRAHDSDKTRKQDPMLEQISRGLDTMELRG